ncbi:MAG: LysR family transcriptional regulator [Pseudomonadota bacterium]
MVDTPGKITLWQMEIFVVAAEEASITATARRLGASASTVSQQLSNLEAALGAKLLERAERPMPLTEAGAIFLRRSQVILNEATQATAELAAQDLAKGIRLRLGMIEDFDADVTPALLTTLAGEMPQAQFRLETSPSHKLIDKLETRGVDVIVTADPGALPPSYAVFPLIEDPYVVVTPRRMVRSDRPVLDQLRLQPLIQYTSRHFMGRQIAAHLGRHNMTVSTRFELDSYHAIMAMVARGEGWSILTPLGVMRAKRFMDRVDLMELPFAPLSRQISLVARKDSLQDIPERLAAILRPLLVSEITEVSKAHMPWVSGQLKVASG